MLHLQSFRKSYGGHTLLSVPDCRLADGLYWLQAPNGAGKSTLLRCIAGIIPFEGSISAAGFGQRRQREAYLRAVSWAEAEPQYPAFLTGSDLISFYCKTRGGSPAEAQSLLARFDAGSFQQRPTGNWSSGMLKKLSLVLAFLGTPRWILLDEPLITLDVAAQAACQGLIAERRAQGTSFLITSHQPLGLSHHSVRITGQSIEL
ncbi:MAG: ATP-binding cassette domain-containing protein [Chitinophagaceae bacterium]|nr:MAG: ATP-binding cassette domain-containing protein [Chitinophagaceae bacterium]